MSLKIFYDPLMDDEGTIIGIQLVLEHKGKYLSIEDYQNEKWIFFDDTEAEMEEHTLNMTKQESFNKINDLIKKVLE